MCKIPGHTELTKTIDYVFKYLNFNQSKYNKSIYLPIKTTLISLFQLLSFCTLHSNTSNVQNLKLDIIRTSPNDCFKNNLLWYTITFKCFVTFFVTSKLVKYHHAQLKWRACDQQIPNSNQIKAFFFANLTC